MLGSVHPDSVLLISGKGARGIVEGDSVPDIFIPRLVNLCTQGRFPFDRLVQYYSLREINQAAEDAEKGAIRKPRGSHRTGVTLRRH
jgi:aryl-alcohol dehydrogenase